jgi:hypothetical protein
MELTEQQAFVVRNLYLSALVPLASLSILHLLGRIPRWVMAGSGIDQQCERGIWLLAIQPAPEWCTLPQSLPRSHSNRGLALDWRHT